MPIVDIPDDLISTWADEMRLHVTEYEIYLQTLRKKGKPTEMMDMMDYRLSTRRDVRDFLIKAAASVDQSAPPAAPEPLPAPKTKPKKEKVEWDD